MVSSKQETMGYINTYVDSMKGSKKLYVVDVARWEARPSSDYSGKTFKVYLGDDYISPKVIDNEIDLKL
jgi:hypothetical protein